MSDNQTDCTLTDIFINYYYMLNQVEEKYLLDKLDVYESAVGDSNTKTAPKIERFPPALQSIPRNPIVLDLAYNCIDFPVIENRMKKKGGFFSSRISSLW